MDLIDCIAVVKAEKGKLPTYNGFSDESRAQHKQAVAAMVGNPDGEAAKVPDQRAR